MNKTGKTVLWFLAGCMAFTEIVVTITAKISDVKSAWVLAFGLLSLMAILVALVIMYTRDPAFLLVQSRDVALLSLIKSLASQNSPELFKQLIEKLTLSSLQGEEKGEDGEEGNEPEESAEEIAHEEVDEESEPEGDGEEDSEYSKSLEKLSKGNPGGTK